MTFLSIIIPHFGNTCQLEDTLASVLQNRPADCEVLLVHPATYDDPYELAGEVRLIEVSAKSTVIDGLNQALTVAEGKLIHIVSPGVEAIEFWTQPALLPFDNPGVAAVTPLVLRRDKPNYIENAGIRLTRLGEPRIAAAGTKHRLNKVAKIKSLGPSLAAAFYRREALEHIGGFSADLGAEFADIDAALALRQAGYQCVLAADSVLRTDRQQRARDHATFATAKRSECLLWRHAPALAGHRTLASRFAIVPIRLLLGAGRPKSFKQALGRIAAWLDIVGHRRYWRRLSRVRENLQRATENDSLLMATPSPYDAKETRLRVEQTATNYKRAS